MKTYSVYVHTCPNGKKYVGITSKDPKRRWLGGKNYRGNVHFTRAINKFGWENINHEIIMSDVSEKTASETEIELILKLNTMNPKFGYNNTTGGEIGKEYSEESIKKMSENRKNIYCGKDHYCFGKNYIEIFGEEGIKKNLENARVRWTGDGNPNRKNPKFGSDNPNFHRVHSKETIQRMIDSHTNRKLKIGDGLKIIKMYYETDMDQKSIAEIYGVSRQTIGDVIHQRISAYETSEYVKPTDKIIRKRAKHDGKRN